VKFHLRLSKIVNIVVLLSLLTSLGIGSAAPFNPPLARAAPVMEAEGFGSPVVDGVIDDLYGAPVASDPADPPQGNFPMDLLDLYVAQDATHFYFAFTVNTDLSANNWGKYAIYIDTTNDANGATSDAWTRDVVANDPHKPEYAIYSWLDSPPYQTGHTQVVPWDQGTTSWNWGAMTNLDEVAIGAGSVSVIEWKLAKAVVGNPSTIWLEVWDTGGGGGDNAQDTINNPADDWNAVNWDDQAVLDVSTQFGAPLIDGQRDQIWGQPVAEDALADMSEPNLDLVGLYLLEDADNYYRGFDAFASNWGMTYGIYLDTDQVDGAGGTSDPWGRAVNAVSAHLPEYALYVYHNDTDTLQDAQLTHWNGGGWDYPTLISVGGAQGYGAADDWIEYQVPKAALGNPARLALEVFTTGSNGHAQDTVPSDPNVAYPSPDFGGDTTTLTAFYIYPPQLLSLSVTAPAQGQAFTLPDIDVMGEVSPASGVTVTVELNSTSTFTPTVDASGAFTQPVTLVSGSNTITVMATDGSNTEEVIRNVTFGASHDDNIWWSELGHNSRDGLYRSPFGAVVSGTLVTLRLRAAENDLTSVKVRLYNDRTNAETLADMERVASDGVHEYWEYQLAVGSDPTVYWYRFIPTDGSTTAYYEDDAARTGGWGETFAQSQDYSWQLTVYDPAYHTPDWVKNAVIYQVFTDRFRDGDATNGTPPGSFFYDDPRGTIFRSNETDWNTPICDPRDDSDPDCANTYSQNFYGGDLQGLIDQLAYLQSLGVTAIYLNQIFEAPSNHKYDATDYSLIDDSFGDLALFQELVTAADSYGIKLILDGVFNHTSSDSIYFDRYGRYSSVGACESPASPYRDWYYFTDVTPGTGTCAGSDGTPLAATYQSWFGYESLPKLRANSQAVRDLIWANGTSSIGPYWIDQGAAGWRLDVGGDVDPGVTNDAGNDYWEGFRAALRAVYSDTYITGEEWGNASPWLLGNEWDAVMNYQYSSAMLGFYRDTPFVDNDHNTSSSAGVINPLDPSALDERLLNWIERYPPEALYAMMNLLGSHDTNRALFMLDHNAATGTDDTVLDNPDYDWSDAINRLMGVAILQMTLPGAPTIYYGDEVGAVGPITYANGKWEDDPYNRVPYPWLDQTGLPFYTFLQSQTNQDNLYNYYKLLANARNANEALRTGSFDPLLMDDAHGVYAYGRKLADHSSVAVVVLSRADTLSNTQTVALDVDGYLPYGAEFVNVLDSTIVTVTAGGLLVVDVPDRGGVVLVPTGSVAAPPAAVTDLDVTDENNAEVVLGWTAAAGADSYDIYRSLLSGGGYTFLANTTDLAYTDSGLTNATHYYYVVVSRNDTQGLVSGNSNEVLGMPQHDLSSAWYNLQWPEEFTHTISAITPTQNIYGQLWIGGFTGGSGPAEGIRAQVGYGISGTLTTEWQWVEMDYDQAVGNNDQYATVLLPDAVGDYHYATRWSSDDGLTWYFSDLGGPGDHADYGLMHVIPGADSVVPDAPQNLQVSGTTASSISLAWDAGPEQDLAGVDIYRQLYPLAGPGSFVRIARLFGVPTSYTDTDVVTNQTYDYYVVAFDTSFNFSIASNIVTATAEPRVVMVTFDVTVPDFTPGTVYIAGSIPGLPNWDPGGQALQQVNSTHWTFTVQLPDGAHIEYKYARGTWDKVEKEADGNAEVPNRQATIHYGTDGTQLIQDVVANWRDPIVVASDPQNGTGNVPVTSTVSIQWSQAMPDATDFTVTGPGGVLSGTFEYEAGTYTATFTPALALEMGEIYTITASGKQDAAGDTQQVAFLSTFQTAPTEPRPVEVTLVVTVPDFTAGTVYISRTVGEQAMTQVDATHWAATLQLIEGDVIEYVYSRGDWQTMETEVDGNTDVAVRQVLVAYGTDGTQLIQDVVANWRDPIVVASDPQNGAGNVPVTSTVSIQWSQAMPVNSTFVLTGPSGVVIGAFTYDPATFRVVFTPSAPVEWGATYTLTITARQDAAGDLQQVAFQIVFTTQPEPPEIVYYLYFPFIVQDTP